MNDAYAQTLAFFAQQLNSSPPQEDVEAGEVELLVDRVRILLKKGKLEGSLHTQIALGFFLIPPDKTLLREIAKSNFLGVDTGGCTLALDSKGITLSLHTLTSPGTTPQENWERLHYTLAVYHHWNDQLAQWKEFTPLIPSDKMTSEMRTPLSSRRI